ncbi:SphA family protein [Parazoarcus communis]|uniref:Phenol degradation protein meta n=1 Tax=Parazoarcus communis SWub3 = DSM 12120 TaxID=1121029 RepID=A0A323UWW9_9RHOO|nr:transporter [Parazoarcus communis]NMG71201.1 phenol degradation protein meta [Parazoarcus communis SWub3 = DSM 12120]PZA17039.1 phenol degradation protein meta [Azoarcus communis] [Parazoarcus communis SWub3 = DSM 12120]
MPPASAPETLTRHRPDASGPLLGKLAGLLCGCVLSASAAAYELPAVNLGLTTFIDGAPPAGPGWYVSEYLQYYSADTLRDKNGKSLPLPKQEIEVTSLVSQAIWMSANTLWGAHYGVTLLLPAVLDARADDGLGNLALGKGNTGVGDLIIGPFLQWMPVMGANGPVFAHRVELDISLPTGEYDNRRSVNPGANHWTINPYWSGTYWLTPKWTVSSRLWYLWSGKNTDPNPTGFAAQGIAHARNVRPGQAFHMNFATEYAVTPQLRIGLNGYWLKQTTESEVNGSKLSGSKEQVLGIGPGLLYSFSQRDHLFFNAYKESHVRNRPEGERYVIRYVHHFE